MTIQEVPESMEEKAHYPMVSSVSGKGKKSENAVLIHKEEQKTQMLTKEWVPDPRQWRGLELRLPGGLSLEGRILLLRLDQGDLLIRKNALSLCIGGVVCGSQSDTKEQMGIQLRVSAYNDSG